MAHPFLLFNLRQLRAMFWFTLAATLAITIVMNILGGPLVTPQAPFGIVSFELAGSPAQAQAILASWDAQAKLYAAFGLGFDYLYMLAYSAVIGLGCLLAAVTIKNRGWPLTGLGAPLAWGMWLAALFDAVENMALTSILLVNATDSVWPAVARQCAILKFVILFVGLAYTFYGLLASLVGRLKR